MKAELVNERNWLRRLYRFSLAARLSVGLLGWVVTYFGLLSSPLLEDALGYEAQGAAIADEWLSGHSSETLHELMAGGTRAWGLSLVLAIFYFLTGGLRVLPVIIAAYCALTAWTPVYTYHIARQLGAPAPGARFGAWLVALSPAFAFWSGALYKEGLILLLLSLAIYHALLVQETGSWRSLCIVAACLPALFALRFYLAMIMFVVLTLGILLARGNRAAVARQILVAVLFGILLVAIGFTDRVQSMMPADLETGLAKIDRSRRDLASYTSGYYGDVDLSTPSQVIAFAPIGFVYFVAAPFPWQFGGLRQNLAIPETLVWVCLYPYLLVGIRAAWREHWQGTLLVIIATAAICLFYAVYCGNIGVAYRMRTQVWVLWAPLIGWGWEVRSVRRNVNVAARPQVRRP